MKDSIETRYILRNLVLNANKPTKLCRDSEAICTSIAIDNRLYKNKHIVIKIFKLQEVAAVRIA